MSTQIFTLAAPCFHYRVPGDENRFLPVRNTTLGMALQCTKEFDSIFAQTDKISQSVLGLFSTVAAFSDNKTESEIGDSKSQFCNHGTKCDFLDRL